jgi:hypothetical protein
MLINQYWIVSMEHLQQIYQPNTGLGVSYIFSLNSWELTSWFNKATAVQSPLEMTPPKHPDSVCF